MLDCNKVKTLLEKVQIGLSRAEVAKGHIRQTFELMSVGVLNILKRNLLACLLI